jgi:hypothetical protein
LWKVFIIDTPDMTMVYRTYSRVDGIGLNREELAKNPQVILTTSNPAVNDTFLVDSRAHGHFAA